MTGGELLLTVILTIIIIAIIAYIIYRFVFAHGGSLTGEMCIVDSDCVAGNYCGGIGVCVIGVSGGTEGSICVRSTDCEVGLLCGTDRCGKNRCTPKDKVKTT